MGTDEGENGPTSYQFQGGHRRDWCGGQGGEASRERGFQTLDSERWVISLRSKIGIPQDGDTQGEAVEKLRGSLLSDQEEARALRQIEAKLILFCEILIFF